ncbi:MAG: 50S ribosomal protein L25 [Leptospiraceae bacterium]|nr:MAG: 50S ribosomal protein L25 [Leptospiraceae bacterium]
MEKKLKAEKRTEFGKNASRRYRRQGKLPANILEKGKSIPVLLNTTEFIKLLNQGLLPSMKIEVELDGETFQALPKEIQRDPVTGEIIHVDLYKMTPGHKFHLNIPVELVGVAKGVKAGGALEHYIQILKIRTTPESLKEKIEVDITNLDVGQAIRLSELNLPQEWDILTQGNPVICKISQSRATVKSQSQ